MFKDMFKEMWCSVFHKKHYKLTQIEYGSVYLARCGKCGVDHLIYRN